MIYGIALMICLVAAAFEGLCAGRDPMAQLRNIRQPSWSPPNWLWVLIGIAWYLICFVTLVRLLPSWSEYPGPTILLCALMLANGGANLLQIRFKRFDLALFFLGPYWLLLAAFLWTACPLDELVCVLFAAYAVYQLYAAAWGYELWSLNRTSHR